MSPALAEIMPNLVFMWGLKCNTVGKHSPLEMQYCRAKTALRDTKTGMPELCRNRKNMYAGSAASNTTQNHTLRRDGLRTGTPKIKQYSPEYCLSKFHASPANFEQHRQIRPNLPNSWPMLTNIGQMLLLWWRIDLVTSRDMP